MLDAHRISRRKPLGTALIIIILILFAVWTLFPILWAMITSFKQPGDSFKATFILSWNEFVFVIVFGYRRAMALPVMIVGALSVRGLDFWKVASLYILAVIPPVILAMSFSRYLVRGLTMGAVKE